MNNKGGTCTYATYTLPIYTQWIPYKNRLWKTKQYTTSHLLHYKRETHMKSQFLKYIHSTTPKYTVDFQVHSEPLTPATVHIPRTPWVQDTLSHQQPRLLKCMEAKRNIPKPHITLMSPKSSRITCHNKNKHNSWASCMHTDSKHTHPQIHEHTPNHLCACT